MEKTFADLALGQNLKTANEEINSALEKYKGNSEFLNYKKYSVLVALEKDQITEMKITDSTSFALSNKLKLGAKQEEVEKLLGKKPKREGNYFLYAGKTKLALRFMVGKLVEIVMYRWPFRRK